jgi:hypothetical protein
VRVNECFAARIPLTLALSREGRGERIFVLVDPIFFESLARARKERSRLAERRKPCIPHRVGLVQGKPEDVAATARFSTAC